MTLLTVLLSCNRTEHEHTNLDSVPISSIDFESMLTTLISGLASSIGNDSGVYQTQTRL